MTGLTQNKALYPFIKSINTDNLCEDFGNISNDNKRQRTMMCPYKGTMDVVSYCRLVVCRIVCFLSHNANESCAIAAGASIDIAIISLHTSFTMAARAFYKISTH